MKLQSLSLDDHWQSMRRHLDTDSVNVAFSIRMVCECIDEQQSRIKKQLQLETRAKLIRDKHAQENGVEDNNERGWQPIFNE